MSARARGLAAFFATIPGGLVFGLAAACLVALPVSFGVVTVPVAWFALAPAFFWAVRKPGAQTVLATFVLGLGHDLLSQGPPGPWAVGYLAAYALAASQAEGVRGQTVYYAWAVFAAAVLACTFMAYAVGWIALGGPPSLGVLVLQAIATIATAPIAMAAFGGFRHVSAHGS